MCSYLTSIVEHPFGATALSSLSRCTLIKDHLHLQATQSDYSSLRQLAVGWNRLYFQAFYLIDTSTVNDFGCWKRDSIMSKIINKSSFVIIKIFSQNHTQPFPLHCLSGWKIQFCIFSIIRMVQHLTKMGFYRMIVAVKCKKRICCFDYQCFLV